MEDLRAKVAQCCRMLCMANLIDFSGHVSAREPGTDRVFIHPRHVSRLEVRPEDVLVVNLEGKLLEGLQQPPMELAMHTEVYKAREDVFAVAHLHPRMVTILGMAGRELVPACMHGALFAGGVPVYPGCHHVATPELGAAVARALGRHWALILKGHGAVVVGESVEAVFCASLRLEESADKLFHASLLGPVQPLSPADIKDMEGWVERSAQKVWDFYVSKARREAL